MIIFAVMDSLRKKEILLYLCVWALLFALAPLSGAFASKSDILLMWKQLLPFLILFIVHDTLLLPLIRKFNGRNSLIYFICLAAILALFGLYCYSHPLPGAPPPGIDGRQGPPGQPIPGTGRPMRPEFMKFIIGLLMLLANAGISAMLRALDSERRLRQIETENIARQIEVLRYQVNPHFFMNTLNNIHTLVQVDPEKARECIEEFSHLMRMSLTDGSALLVPLERELQCLQSFISLMRIRYPESVDIQLSLPESCGDTVAPPLLMTSCLENAFKHGISYEEPSFVHFGVKCEDGKVFFYCTNSVHRAESSERGGFGLENLRRRLDLTYGKASSFSISENEKTFTVTIVFPARWEIKS